MVVVFDTGLIFNKSVVFVYKRIHNIKYNIQELLVSFKKLLRMILQSTPIYAQNQNNDIIETLEYFTKIRIIFYNR